MAKRIVIPLTFLFSRKNSRAFSSIKWRFRRVMISICLILLFLPFTLFAQKKVQILQADSIVGGHIHGAPIQKILGNVHLRSKNIDMYADSAYKFSNQQEVQAFGNIEIDTQKETIWADTLIYYTDIDFSKLRGRVVLESDSTTLFGNKVDYRFTNKVAHFMNKVRLEDQRGTLVANSGFYFRQPDSATFRGHVQLRDSLKYIEGNRLFSNRRRHYYEMHGNVFADDPKNQSMLKGDYLEADSTGRRLVKGHAWLKNFKKDTTQTNLPADSSKSLRTDTTFLRSPLTDSLQTQSDTLHLQRDSLRRPPADSSRTSQPDTTHIHAARILSIQHRMPHDTTTTVKAYKNVRIWSPDFSAVSDSVKYQSSNNTFQLWVKAKAWHKNIQLSGPYIRVKMQNGDIKRLISYPHPFTVQHDTLIDRLDQIKGDTLQAFFKKGQLRLIRVHLHSQILRFTQKEQQADGLIQLHAPITRIYFEQGKLVHLKSLGKEKMINGNYLPESPAVADTKLDGFSWDPKLRPHRPKEKMQRRFPPIPDHPPFELPERYLKHIGKSKPKKNIE